MKRTVDAEAILAPIPGENPSGQNLRYEPVFDEIAEARRADDLLNRGDWNRELKTSDWEKVFELSTTALSQKTKDIRIAAWLAEALIKTEGFEGFAIGLKILAGLLGTFWESIYPEIEDGDLEFRVGPIEFINDKISTAVKEIPITDPKVSPGYSWFKWQESRQVGSEADCLNQWGDVEESKKKSRDEKIAEGKITAEEFQSALTKSSRAFYEDLQTHITSCLDEFQKLDEAVDDKFGKEAPRLSDLKSSLDEVNQQVAKILKEKRAEEPDRQEPAQDQAVEETASEIQQDVAVEGTVGAFTPQLAPADGTAPRTYSVNRLLGSGGNEETLWASALSMLKTSGIEKAIELLLGAACSAQSIREQTNYRLLMAKLCLQADRPDLARPIAEQLNAVLEEFQLTRWESPIWVAEVYDLLYRCLVSPGATDDEKYRAAELLNKICTNDVTKAMKYK